MELRYWPKVIEFVSIFGTWTIKHFNLVEFEKKLTYYERKDQENLVFSGLLNDADVIDNYRLEFLLVRMGRYLDCNFLGHFESIFVLSTGN